MFSTFGLKWPVSLLPFSSVVFGWDLFGTNCSSHLYIKVFSWVLLMLIVSCLIATSLVWWSLQRLFWATDWGIKFRSLSYCLLSVIFWASHFHFRGFTPLGDNNFCDLAVITDTHKCFWNQAMSDVLATSVFLDRKSLSVVALSLYSFIASGWAGQCQSLLRSLLLQV